VLTAIKTRPSRGMWGTRSLFAAIHPDRHFLISGARAAMTILYEKTEICWLRSGPQRVQRLHVVMLFVNYSKDRHPPLHP